jgi:hypothetical protein
MVIIHHARYLILGKPFVACIFVATQTREKWVNGSAHFVKCKQLFEYQHLLLLRDIWGKSCNLYLDVVHFFNMSVNYISVAAWDSCFPLLMSNMHSSNVKLAKRWGKGRPDIEVGALNKSKN